MKKLIYAVILFYSAILKAPPKTVAFEDHPAYCFTMGALCGTFPLVGQIVLTNEILNFRKSPDAGVRSRVKPTAYGLATGTIIWAALLDMLESEYPDSSWEPYVLASSPLPLTLAIVLLLHYLKRTIKRKISHYKTTEH